ncbi:ATP-binding cassette domain-containing protein [uncultured Methanobrevibacter sp.]|mgnify:CR=1 FL=1|uniref:ATP-binding cassette domain-containing protein n=1 Tax=uncultured Methanobrevibacter sp. TaxID=253161 RepID=UPI00260647EB|nr:ATP-binding cassette domain-containing protein [uncultured Methanobrevibacter sp.]
MTETVIELQNIVKKYNDVAVVDDLSLKVKKGEILGFLGPNGAGKSTSINMMVGLLKPTSGTILFNGKDSSNLDKKEIGICPQDIVLWNTLTCFENLYMMGKMYNVPKKVLKDRILEILEKLHLIDKKNELISSLSGGMKRRMNIAMATIHNPSIVVLDEPSEGLDPQSRRLLWDYILYQKELGNTVILTTHLMDEADMLSDRVAIIDHGELLKLDTPKKLKQIIGKGDTVQLELNNYEDNPKIISALKSISDLNKIFETEDKINLILLDAVKKLPDIIHLVENNNSKIIDISIRQNTLEDVFIELTGRQLRE